jgi:hypothetical protein
MSIPAMIASVLPRASRRRRIRNPFAAFFRELCNLAILSPTAHVPRPLNFYGTFGLKVWFIGMVNGVLVIIGAGREFA